MAAGWPLITQSRSWTFTRQAEATAIAPVLDVPTCLSYVSKRTLIRKDWVSVRLATGRPSATVGHPTDAQPSTPMRYSFHSKFEYDFVQWHHTKCGEGAVADDTERFGLRGCAFRLPDSVWMLDWTWVL